MISNRVNTNSKDSYTISEHINIRFPLKNEFFYQRRIYGC
jgi:hypothetical protein